MKAIWKYPITAHEVTISLPAGAEVLTVQMQGGFPQIWALVNPEMSEMVPCKFMVVGTGWRFDPSRKKYIGTWQDGSLVWHLWEVYG